jgi:hypothetical protein
MRFNDGYAFPHPVLGVNDDINGTAAIERVDYDETSDPNNYILTIQYTLANAGISALLNEKKAQFFCELSCTSTLYRKAELSSDATQIIKIPKNFVREKVELLFLMIATQPIPSYTNADAHADFDGYTFTIDNGDVLAYLGESYFIAGVAYQKLKAISSFMEIIRGENETGDFNIILENPKIQIQLPKLEYQQYSEPAIGKNMEYASTFHASIVLPALIHALYQLADPAKEDLKDTAWAKIIQFRLDNDEQLNGVALNEDNVIKIAQYLLGMPVGRLLLDLHNKAMSASDD